MISRRCLPLIVGALSLLIIMLIVQLQQQQGIGNIQVKDYPKDKAAQNPMSVLPTTPRAVTDVKKRFTILDWSPVYLSLENGLPETFNINNCIITRNRSALDHSDVIVIEVRRLPHLTDVPPKRKPEQRWVYFNVESPYNAILDYKGNYKMNDFKGKIAFNWTMTYRKDSDAPLAYGWTIKRDSGNKPEVKPGNIFKEKTKLAAALISNCVYVKNGRIKYIKETQKYMKLDFYGDCGNLKCEGHWDNKPCQKIKEYKFYFAFENSNCRDYISEKIWKQAFENKAVPVVMGAFKEDYIKVAPPNSFIHVDDFNSPKDLASYLNMLSKNESAYLKYQAWRKDYSFEYDFRMLSKKAYGWQSLCNTLNKRGNDAPSWYKTITDFENEKKDCYQNKWVVH